MVQAFPASFGLREGGSGDWWGGAVRSFLPGKHDIIMSGLTHFCLVRPNSVMLFESGL